jgi:hypothetical protein
MSRNSVRAGCACRSPSIKFHAAAASARAISSTTIIDVIGSISRPSSAFDAHPEQPRLVHRRRDLRRQPPLVLALVAARAHERRDPLCRLDQRRIRDRPVHYPTARR